MKSIKIKAPAKINIGLNIVGKREDGFHNLETFFYPIQDLFDELTFELSDKFIFECDNEELNSIKSNLVVKAKELIEQEIGKELNVKIVLKKHIPTGAGLGGGSSDAAATLISLNEMFSLNISFNRLSKLALQLGSDVPFFLLAKPAVGKSRGEILSLTNFNIPHPILIVNPKIHISTKDAFNNIKPIAANINYDSALTDFNSFLEVRDKVVNDFESFVFAKYPQIKEIKELMLREGALFSLMSGSGSTVYGIFENYEQARKVSALFPEDYLKIITNAL